MRRHLESAGHMFWLLNQNSPVHFAVCAQGGGTTAIEDWRNALDTMQQCHPNLFGFNETGTIDPANRLVPSMIVRNYLRVLTHPICLGYILINAASMGVIFAYATAHHSSSSMPWG